jgi:hypothetical protein
MRKTRDRGACPKGFAARCPLRDSPQARRRLHWAAAWICISVARLLLVS